MSRWAVAMAALVLVGVSSEAWAEPPAEVRGLEVAGRVEAPPAGAYSSRVALVVGIDDYEAPALRLKTARGGAAAIADVLRHEFGFDRVITLYDEEASRQAVLGALADLRNTQPDDALLIFWAGHGTTLRTADDEELGYLVPWDGALRGDRALVSNISMEEVRSVVGLAIPARHKLLVVDACYGGLLTMRGSPLLPEDEAWLGGVLQRDVFQILTAGEADQTVLDTGPRGQSVFTGRFLEVLGETKDYVTATELAAAVQRRVRADAWARGGHVQTPAFGRIAGTGDFVLLREAAPGVRAQVDRGPRRSKGLAAVSAASWVVGIAGMVVAGVARSQYLDAPLGAPAGPGLLATNRAAGVAGV
ncbi:MAG: caspase family protein, partial [Deltaproteobacteria bacterium]|nr:caspase family protein [Deltaproteobacteria bacterium]